MYVSWVLIVALVAVVAVWAKSPYPSSSGSRQSVTPGPSTTTKARSILVGVLSAIFLVLMLAASVGAVLEFLVPDPRHRNAPQLHAPEHRAP